MAVDLGDLVDRARNEVGVPGADLFPSATEDDWISHLASAFWDARLNGWFVGYSEADGLVTPDTVGDADLSGRDQQLIVLWCGYRVVRNEAIKLRTKIRNQAGPVSQEQQRSATLMAEILKSFREKLKELREEEVGSKRGNVAVFDAAFLRHDSLLFDETSWLS